jgi:hypothetical protein
MLIVRSQNDWIIVEQREQMEKMMSYIQKLGDRIDTLVDDGRSSTKAVLDKAVKVVPNEEYAVIPADDESYKKALTLMQASVRVIEKSFDFNVNPFNYLLEVVTRSNSIANNCGLSKVQQTNMIMSFIPVTSAVYKDLLLLDDLEGIFHYANLCSTTTLTRSEILAKIDSWSLNTTNYATLNKSLALLRTLYADLSGKGKDVNKSDLYRQVLQRCKKEPRIPAFVMKFATAVPLWRPEVTIVIHEEVNAVV